MSELHDFELPDEDERPTRFDAAARAERPHAVAGEDQRAEGLLRPEQMGFMHGGEWPLRPRSALN